MKGTRKEGPDFYGVRSRYRSARPGEERARKALKRMGTGRAFSTQMFAAEASVSLPTIRFIVRVLEGEGRVKYMGRNRYGFSVWVKE